MYCAEKVRDSPISSNMPIKNVVRKQHVKSEGYQGRCGSIFTALSLYFCYCFNSEFTIF